jgi:hypothetical protein
MLFLKKQEVIRVKMNNNVVAVGLFVALVAIVLGTWASLNYVDYLTGAATSVTGSTNVTVTSVTSCTILDDLVSFGQMARGDSNTSSGIGDYMEIENDGNTNITIVGNRTQDLWSAQPAPSTYWRIRCVGTPDTGATCDSTFQNVAGDGSSNTLVTGLSPIDSKDNITIGFNITVPTDEPYGYKNGTVTFYCSQT